MNPVIKEVFNNFIIYVAPPAFSFLAAYAVYLLKKLRNKIKEKNGDHALNIFDDIVSTVVLSLNQTKVKEMKKIVKKVDKKEALFLKNYAKQRVEEIVSKEIKKNIKYIVKDYNKYLDDAIEAKVSEQKK